MDSSRYGNSIIFSTFLRLKNVTKTENVSFYNDSKMLQKSAGRVFRIARLRSKLIFLTFLIRFLKFVEIFGVRTNCVIFTSVLIEILDKFVFPSFSNVNGFLV